MTTRPGFGGHDIVQISWIGGPIRRPPRRSPNHVDDLGETDAAVEEGRRGLLLAALKTAVRNLPATPRHAPRRSPNVSRRRVRTSRCDCVKSGRRHPRDPRGPAQRQRDRQLHRRWRRLGHCRAVDEGHRGMHHRLGWTVTSIRSWHPEQQVGLDQFERLLTRVAEFNVIIRPIAQVGGEALRRGHIRELGTGPAAKQPPDAVSTSEATSSDVPHAGTGPSPNVPNRPGSAVRAPPCIRHECPTGDERLLVRERARRRCPVRRGSARDRRPIDPLGTTSASISRTSRVAPRHRRTRRDPGTAHGAARQPPDPPPRRPRPPYCGSGRRAAPPGHRRQPAPPPGSGRDRPLRSPRGPGYRSNRYCRE